MPVIDGLFGSKRINVMLDTGSTRTLLTPRFALDFPDAVAKGRKESTHLRGIGGTTEVSVVLLPEVRFQAAGFGLVLRPAQVLPPDARVDRNDYHVWLGMELLDQARGVTLDFRSVCFALE